MAKLEFFNNSKALVVKINEEIDHHSCSVLKDKLDVAINLSKIDKLVFDFTGVNFMDSSGIGMIMGRYKSIQKNSGKVAITGLQPTVKKIVQMSGLHKILEEYDNLDIALNKLNIV
ncbi:MAG: STAS domain-containing protein [Clostridiales bacterium]|nr:STAS domain-containing protein [Clostridiales bacterium]